LRFDKQKERKIKMHLYKELRDFAISSVIAISGGLQKPEKRAQGYISTEIYNTLITVYTMQT
jgi:hypothetical protein